MLDQADRNTKIFSDRGAYFTKSTLLISHHRQYIIVIMLLLIVERMEVFDLVDDSTKDMSMHFIIVKLDINFKRLYKAFRILDKKLLLPLDKRWHSILSEYVKEDVVLITYDGWH